MLCITFNWNLPSFNALYVVVVKTRRPVIFGVISDIFSRTFIPHGLRKFTKNCLQKAILTRPCSYRTYHAPSCLINASAQMSDALVWLKILINALYVHIINIISNINFVEICISYIMTQYLENNINVCNNCIYYLSNYVKIN